MRFKSPKHVFSVIDLISMGTTNYTTFDLLNEWLERSRRPGELFCPLIQLKNMLGWSACSLFGFESTRIVCLNLAPEWLLLFVTSPPCTYIAICKGWIRPKHD